MEEKYRYITSVYNKFIDKLNNYKNINSCCMWLVENMYKIDIAYTYGDDLEEGAYLAQKLDKLIDIKYKNKEKEKKLTKECANYFKKLDIYVDGSNIKFDETLKLRKNSKVENREYFVNIFKTNFEYFRLNVNKKNNYLIPDHIDSARRKINREKNITSPTNIGLSILAYISAIDLKIITFDEGLEVIKNIVHSVDGLNKWNGLMYNWYYTKSKKPLKPLFISTVDTCNYLASIKVLKGFLKEYGMCNSMLYKKCVKHLKNVDLNKVKNKENGQIYIGYFPRSKVFTSNTYDRLMSETRTMYTLGYELGSITMDTYLNLKRERKEETLMSWTATSFEYFLPNIFLDIYENSVIDKTCRGYIEKQDEFCKENNLKYFGFSACSMPKRNRWGYYNYKECGIPSLRLRFDRSIDLVCSPHASLLQLDYIGKKVLNNIQKLTEDFNITSKYGFFDAVDLTDGKVAKIWNAHNQGMILASINNYLNDGILRSRYDISNKAAYLLKEVF